MPNLCYINYNNYLKQSLQQELASEAKALRENAADERARFAER